MKLWGRRKQQASGNPSSRMGVSRSLQPWEQTPALLAISQAPDVSFGLYRGLRRGIPVLQAAIMELKRLVGMPKVVAEEPLKTEIENFLENFNVIGYRQVGLVNFLQLLLDTYLLYGKAAAEIVLTNARNGVYGLKPVPIDQLELVPGTGGQIQVGQRQVMGGMTPVMLDEDLLFYSVLSPQDGRPHGTSLFASLPFVGEIWLKMAWGLGKTWERFGTPTYHVNTEFPEGMGLGPEQQEKVKTAIADEFESSMTARRDMHSIKDFFSVGKVRIEVIGAQGEQLDFQVPNRAIMEQICTVTGLPPFWFGFQWASSERLSSEQAKKVSDNVSNWRNELTPDLKHLIALHLALRGLKGNWSLSWAAVNLTDRTQNAQADMMEAQARAITEKTAVEAWRQGILNQEQTSKLIYPDLVAVATPRTEPVEPTPLEPAAGPPGGDPALALLGGKAANSVAPAKVLAGEHLLMDEGGGNGRV